jgi:hypothetical protein
MDKIYQMMQDIDRILEAAPDVTKEDWNAILCLRQALDYLYSSLAWTELARTKEESRNNPPALPDEPVVPTTTTEQ